MSATYAPIDILWQRVMSRIVVTESGCWEFQGAVTSRGYGCVGSGRKGKSVTTHRLAVLVRDGEIPDGLTVDHLCHNASECKATGKDCRHRRCVNPDHLDVCTGALNNSRARSRWAYCPRGHQIRTEIDREALTSARLCECGVISVTHLPADTFEHPRWYRELEQALAKPPSPSPLATPTSSTA